MIWILFSDTYLHLKNTTEPQYVMKYNYFLVAIYSQFKYETLVLTVVHYAILVLFY